jgi:hypothetical protein
VSMLPTGYCCWCDSSGCYRCRPTPVQMYWKCAHHPSALENFFGDRYTCEWMCHTQELRPHHSGFHPGQ